MRALKLFAWRQDSTGDIILTHGTDRFSAAEVLCVEYPESDVEDFCMIAEGEAEFLESVLAGEFGGIVVLRDTTYV